jgi:hypothetical protein
MRCTKFIDSDTQTEHEVCYDAATGAITIDGGEAERASDAEIDNAQEWCFTVGGTLLTLGVEQRWCVPVEAITSIGLT